MRPSDFILLAVKRNYYRWLTERCGRIARQSALAGAILIVGSAASLLCGPTRRLAMYLASGAWICGITSLWYLSQATLAERNLALTKWYIARASERPFTERTFIH